MHCRLSCALLKFSVLPSSTINQSLQDLAFRRLTELNYSLLLPIFPLQLNNKAELCIYFLIRDQAIATCLLLQ